MRVKFKKGMQRRFFNLVIECVGCLSLRGLKQFGLNTSYSCLKNYYTERRLMKRELFEDLCYLGKINKSKFSFILLEDNWGQVKGGKKKVS
jgi:hypothetical protein